MISNLKYILNEWIKSYCKKHHFDIMEINFKEHYVAYWTHDEETVYDTFNYLEVDLFN